MLYCVLISRSLISSVRRLGCGTNSKSATTLMPSPRSTAFQTPSRLSISNTGLIASPASCIAASKARRVVEPRSRSTKGCSRSEEHTSELQSRENLVCRLLLEKKKKKKKNRTTLKKKKKNKTARNINCKT